MKRLTNYGFTLIELLVVIAIIGILAAVVLTSLGGAQEGAQSSNVQQTLGTVTSEAQLEYNNNEFSYDALCDELDDTGEYETLDNLAEQVAYIADTVVVNSTPSGDNEILCNDDITEYMITAPLIVDGTVGGAADDGYWCVDSQGFRGEIGDYPTPGSTRCNP